MPRAKIWGFLAVILSAGLFALSLFSFFIINDGDFSSFSSVNLTELNSFTYYSASIPIAAVTLWVLATGFWIGWVILTIKVVPPMPEIVEKKDNSKIKAFFLCLITAALAALLVYGVYIRSFWSLAVPALVISAVILGAIFWVGMAIITTRATLPVNKK
ncbi:MAG TPA: hypothetical protein P5120_14130 [Spirochaetota bacterium]|nr:hypothetical protein [Spirochaetota bacterium]HPF06583.1 hypothetical protein [Spirochaetota bacterium]HPJ43287.1 hypothetical protein [Spirochaetota bacterium]HPR38182.1 hypothetical protein [Spirochaetota bacterium]HRX48654.1 hypothetical protein [Spirochaetota bacterium]